MGKLWVAAGMMLVLAASARGEMSRAEIEGGIEQGVKFLISKQGDDGHWPYQEAAGAENPLYKVGHTALVVLALQHSGNKSPEAQLAIKKGLSYIVQQQPEPTAYSAGLVAQVLYMDSVLGNRMPMTPYVTAYGWMLCGGQKQDGADMGGWGYLMPTLPKTWMTSGPGNLMSRPEGVNNSTNQFGLLGTVYVQKSGFQVPRVVWERQRAYLTRTQHPDGGWDYLSDVYRASLPEGHYGREPRPETINMTLAGTVSVYMCDEMLADKSHRVCKAPEPDKTHEEGLKWIAKNWNRLPGGGGMYGAYGWYSCERLGILTGYSEFGGHDWFQAGAPEMMGAAGSGDTVMASLGVLFLSRGRNPIIINKLRREGDWNLHWFDLSHLTEYISGPGQKPCQWRIVTLTVPVDYLLKVPMLWISGHDALNFTAEEKAKLKEYVEKGGTILAEDCCSKKAFDESFRGMLKELWPEKELTEVPKTHAIYTSYRKLASAPRLMGLTMGGEEGRPGVIYLPNGISCKWEVAGTDARGAMDAGMNIYLYVDKMFKQAKAEAEKKDGAL